MMCVLGKGKHVEQLFNRQMSTDTDTASYVVSASRETCDRGQALRSSH